MTEQEKQIERLKSITIDHEFDGICPPLTADEYAKLEKNILTDGEVTAPLIIWNGVLVDGHHRRKILLDHPYIPFAFKEMNFSCRNAVIAWICTNQLGRRNLTPSQRDYLCGTQYAAERMLCGGDRKSTEAKSNGQNVHLLPGKTTAEKIAEEYGINERTVRRNGHYAKGVDAAENACPGIRRELLSGKLGLNKGDVIDLANVPVDEIPRRIAEFSRIQREKEEKRRRERDEARKNANSFADANRVFKSIGEFSASMAEPKRHNDISNVLGIINESARILKETCEAYISEFPSLLEEDLPHLLQAVGDMRAYFEELSAKMVNDPNYPSPPLIITQQRR